MNAAPEHLRRAIAVKDMDGSQAHRTVEMGRCGSDFVNGAQLGSHSDAR